MMSGFPKDKVIVHDTAVLGRPNVAKMSIDAAKKWDAQVVIVTSNPEGSRDRCCGCMQRCWDSCFWTYLGLLINTIKLVK